MKLRQFVILPLGLFALVGCGGTALSKEAANAKMADMAEKMMTTTYTSIEASVDATADIGLVQFEEVVTDPLATSDIAAEVALSLKGKDLDKTTGEVALTASGSLISHTDDTKMMDVEGDIGFYYVEEFQYLNLALSAFNPETNATESISSKQKAEVGPFTPIVPEISSEDLPVDLEVDYEELIGMLNQIDNVKATDKGGVVEIKYVITQDDVIDMFTQFAVDLTVAITGSELTSEEIAAIREEIAVNVNAMITIRKAEITVEINKDGFLSKLAANLDVDFTSSDEYYDEVTDETIDIFTKMTLKLNVEFGLRINQPVTITYPDFADYMLVDALMLPF